MEIQAGLETAWRWLKPIYMKTYDPVNRKKEPSELSLFCILKLTLVRITITNKHGDKNIHVPIYKVNMMSRVMMCIICSEKSFRKLRIVILLVFGTHKRWSDGEMEIQVKLCSQKQAP